MPPPGRPAGYRSRAWRNHSIVWRSPSSTSTRGSQPSSLRARVMSGCRIFGSSTGSGWKTMRARAPGQTDDPLRELEESHLLRVADVDGVVDVGLHQAPDALDEVRHVLEGPGLGAVAVDRDRLAAKRLADEVRDRPPVVPPHPGPERVEDPDDAGVEAVVAMVGHRDRLGEALGLVVDPARPDGVHVAPVVLPLRVDEGIAVDLRRRREEEPRALGLGETQRLVGPERPHLEGRDRQQLVVHRAGRAREVKHVVDRAGHVDVVGDVELDELEPLGAQPVDVVAGAGREVVEAENLGALVEEELAQVGADESRPPVTSTRMG